MLDAVFTSHKVIKIGSQGPSVRQLQRNLNARFKRLGIISAISVLTDGNFGPETLSAIKYLQCIGGLPVNGEVEERTLALITQGVAGLETLSLGSYGTNVLSVQQAISTAQVRVLKDGQFDTLTERGVKIYQQKLGLLADGVVGPRTWKAVVRSRLDGLPCLALLPYPYS